MLNFLNNVYIKDFFNNNSFCFILLNEIKKHFYNWYSDASQTVQSDSIALLSSLN